MKIRVSDLIFKILADYGVQNVFLVTGGGAMFLNNGLLQEKRLTPICCHNESGAAIAAEGESRVTGKLSVVSVTTGPGGTNAMTGLIGAWLDSQPVLFISGQVKFSTTIASQPELSLRQLGDQEINIVDMVRSVTKYSIMITNPERIKYEMEKAIYLATHGRKGPVWLDIPINVQSSEVEEASLEEYIPLQEDKTSKVSQDDIDAVISSLKKATSPVIIGGQGIRLADAVLEYRQLIAKLNIPIMATFEGFDMLPTNLPQLIGRIGTIGTRAGNLALQNADWVLCIGSRNNIRQISYNYKNFAFRAKNFIYVDIDENELNKHTLHPTQKIHSDAGVFLRSLLASLKEYSIPKSHHDWLVWCQERREKYPVVIPEYKNMKSGINPYVFTQTLSAQLPKGAVIACANATPSLTLFQAGVVKDCQRMICNSGCAAMGYGLPCALGAAVAVKSDDVPVICLEGDGSLMMNIQEMQTIIKNRLPIKMFLYNNGEYCSIRQTHDRFFHARIGCDSDSGVDFPDWQKVADAFGWKYVSINTEEEMLLVINHVLKEEGAVFCDVHLTPGYFFAPKLSSRRMPDGTIISPSLEDMYPFLSPEEMQKNIYTRL